MFDATHWIDVTNWFDAALQVKKFGLVAVDPEGNLPLAGGGTTDVKLELRLMRSNPASIAYLATLYGMALERIEFDLLVDIPHGVSPLVSNLSQRFNKPFITIRDIKRPEQNEFIGEWTVGQRCVVIDDVLASGATKAARIKRLQEAGLIIVAVVVFVDREEGGIELFAKEGFNVPVWPGMDFQIFRHVVTSQ